LIIFLTGIGAFFYFAPRILRAIKAKIWFAWKKLNGPADRNVPVQLPITLPARLASVFNQENVLGETIAWTAQCISGRSRRIPANLFGTLVATREEPRKLIFVTRKLSRTIDLEGSVVDHEPRFLFENLVISPAPGKGPRYLFMFPRSDAWLVERIVHGLREPILSEQEQGAAVSGPP
jgi:hypothetical protein